MGLRCAGLIALFIVPGCGRNIGIWSESGFNTNAGCPGPASVVCCDGISETMPTCANGQYVCPPDTWQTPPGTCTGERCVGDPPFECCQGDELAFPICSLDGLWDCPDGFLQSPPADCEGPPFSDCPCAGLDPVYTPDVILQDPQAFIGEVVWLTGRVQPGAIMGCTDCNPGEPCCQVCAGPVELTGAQSASITLAGVLGDLGVGCYGDGCDTWCAPVLAGYNYCAQGVIEGSGNQLQLAMGPVDPGETFCPVSCEPLDSRILSCGPNFIDGAYPPTLIENEGTLFSAVMSVCPGRVSGLGTLPDDLRIDFRREVVVSLNGDTGCTGRLNPGSAFLCPGAASYTWCLDFPPTICDAPTPHSLLIAVRRPYLGLNIEMIDRFLSDQEFQQNPPCTVIGP